jgi:hypothetical protein
VIAFPGKRPDTRAPSVATPVPGNDASWPERHLDMFFDVDGWLISARGNRYLRLDRYCHHVSTPGRSTCRDGRKRRWTPSGNGRA